MRATSWYLTVLLLAVVMVLFSFVVEWSSFGENDVPLGVSLVGRAQTQKSHPLFRALASNVWPGKFEMSESSAHDEAMKTSSLLVKPVHQGIGRRASFGVNGTRRVFLASLPGVGLSEYLLDVFEQHGARVIRRNRGLYPFSPASGHAVDIDVEESGVEWRWWDFDASVQPDSEPSAKDGGQYVVEGSVGIAASWPALRRTFGDSKFIFLLPRNALGVEVYWNSLAAWIAREEECENSGLLPSRVRAALLAYLAPLAVDSFSQNLLQDLEKMVGSQGARTQVGGGVGRGLARALGRFFELSVGQRMAWEEMEDAKASSIASLVVGESANREFESSDVNLAAAPGILMETAKELNLTSDARMQPWLWSLAAIWHARMAQRVFQYHHVGNGPALLLLDAAAVATRAQDILPSVCDLIEEGDDNCPFSQAAVVPATTPIPVSKLSLDQDAETRCVAAGGIFSPHSPFLQQRRDSRGLLEQWAIPEHESATLRDQRPRGRSDLARAPRHVKVALVWVELNPLESTRWPSMIHGVAMVESYRRFGGKVLSSNTDVYFLHHGDLAPWQEEVLKAEGIQAHRIPDGVAPTTKRLWRNMNGERFFVAKYHALALDEYDRVLYADSDILFHSSPLPFLLAPRNERVAAMWTRFRRMFRSKLAPDEGDFLEEPPKRLPNIVGRGRCSGEGFGIRTLCDRAPVIPPFTLPTTPLYHAHGRKRKWEGGAMEPWAESVQYTGAPFESVNAGIFVSTPRVWAVVDFMDAFLSFRELGRIYPQNVVSKEEKTNFFQMNRPVQQLEPQFSGGGYAVGRRFQGWYQFGPTTSAIERQVYSRDTEVAAARFRGFPKYGERVVSTQPLFGHGDGEQGLALWLLHPMREGKGLLLQLGSSMSRTTTPFFSHFYASRKPWNARRPTSFANLLRPLIEVVLKRNAKRSSTWRKEYGPILYEQLRSMAQDVEIPLVNGEHLERVSNRTGMYWWYVPDSSRLNVDWDDEIRLLRRYDMKHEVKHVSSDYLALLLASIQKYCGKAMVQKVFDDAGHFVGGGEFVEYAFALEKQVVGCMLEE